MSSFLKHPRSDTHTYQISYKQEIPHKTKFAYFQNIPVKTFLLNT